MTCCVKSNDNLKYAICITSYVWLKHMTKKNSLFLSSKKKKKTCHIVLWVSLHTATHPSPAAALTAGQRKGNPWHPNLLETFLKLCVFLCVHMHKCVSSLNRSNMWVQLESRRLSYPLLRWCKFQSQKHNMNFSLFSRGAIELHKVKLKISNVLSLEPLIWSFLHFLKSFYSFFRNFKATNI